MSNKEILTQIIAEVLDVEKSEIGDLEGKSLFEDLGFDSVSIVELITVIEEKLSINLYEDELIDNIVNFDTLLATINSK